MSIPTYLDIIEKLFTELDLLLQNFVFNGYSAMANALRYPLGLAITLYIIFLGISISQGWVKLSMGQLVKSVLKIGVIYTFAMNWGVFSSYIVNLISNGASELGSIIANATTVPLPHFAGEGMNGAMQSEFIEFTDVGAWIWNMGSWHNFSPFVTAILTWAFEFALLLVAVLELIVSKVMLSILLTMAPLFIGFTVFKPTQGFFDRWLGALVGHALLLIFVSGVLALAMSISEWSIADTYLHKAVNITFVGFVPAMFAGFIGLGMIRRVSHLAQSIGGTVVTSSKDGMLASMMGGFMVGGLSMMSLPFKGVSAAGKMFKSLFHRKQHAEKHPSQAKFNVMQINLRTGKDASESHHDE